MDEEQAVLAHEQNILAAALPQIRDEVIIGRVDRFRFIEPARTPRSRVGRLRNRQLWIRESRTRKDDSRYVLDRACRQTWNGIARRRDANKLGGRHVRRGKRSFNQPHIGIEPIFKKYDSWYILNNLTSEDSLTC